MRSRLAVRCAALCALAAMAGPVRAMAQQAPFESQLIFSIAGGVSSAGGQLWDVQHQPIYVIGSSAPAEFDSVGLARFLRPGIAVSLGATLMRSRHVGFTAEVAYFDLASEERCTAPAAFKPDPPANENLNAQACSNAQGLHVPTSVIGIQLGAAWRFVSEGRVHPYVRGSVGVGLLGNSYVLTNGNVVAPTNCSASNSICTLTLLDGESTPEMGLIGTLAAGASIMISPGYRFRFEARDLIAELPTPQHAAPPSANGVPVAPVSDVLRHIPVFTVGLDVVLERRRGRRY
jgi:hypothetical protein